MEKYDPSEETPRAQETKRLLKLIAKRPSQDDSVGPGVLLSDAIKHYVDEFDLIRPFDENNLKPACYKLTIGDEYSVGGRTHRISPASPENELKIPRFEVAIIKTRETLNLPRFLIGRWNIQVKRAYQGLIWVGGPQVDPGWAGNLCCPIYNLSDQEVTLRYGESIAVIDFVKTTTFHEGRSKPYLKADAVPDRVLFQDYQPEKLKSALSTFINEAYEEFKKRIDGLQNRVDSFISVTFAVVALLFAAMTLFFGKPNAPNWWDPSVFWICTLSIVISMFAWVNSRSGVAWFTRTWHRIAFELVIFGLVVASIFYFSTRTQTNVGDLEKRLGELEKQVQELKLVEPAKPSPKTGQESSLQKAHP
jgi:deoxycytidine triphosphate deaminase